ncbi:major facilitator superfamily domain-containing protein [Xylariomycetidae sp. FL0641]|nr:major facilitator superfamily domain-containing protein [Xylariomycetidae sp. FL0641]
MSIEKRTRIFCYRPHEAHPDDLQEVCLNDDAREKPSPLPPGRRPECLKNMAHECLFVGLIAFAAATPVFLQRSIVVVAASIAQSMRMTPAQLAWSTASSGLTTGAFLIPFGHLADTCTILPRKTLLVISLIAFALLVACTSFAPNGIILDLLSGLTGLACAASIPIAVGILSLVYPVSTRRKNMVFSSFLMGTPAATIIGGLGSGALALEVSWRAPFISLAALYTIIAALAWIFVPNVSEPHTVSDKSELRILTGPNTLPVIAVETPRRRMEFLQFDWIGLFLLVTGVLLFTVSLTIGPEGPEPWKTPTVICLLTLGALALGCFIIWETESWSVTLVIVCTLSASMAFYSQLFWVSIFMQQLEGLKPFDVAVRLLPQALVGLMLSPLVGLIMHRISGTLILAAAASALVISNVLLVFLQPGSNYLTWIFPSLMLSTIGMDWTMNVGSLHILSCLPVQQHSIGASLLQTTSRLAVPLGMAVTTAVWASYDGKDDVYQPQSAYTHTFITTTAFASLCLVLVPFIHIGKQGMTRNPEPDPTEAHSFEDEKPSFPTFISPMSSTPLEPAAPPTPPSDIDLECEKYRQPSKRWSPLGSTAPSITSRRPSTVAASESSVTSKQSMDTRKTESTARTTIKQGRSPSEKVIWVVCEECGTSKFHTETAHPVLGDPVRYFNDPTCGGGSPVAQDQPHHHIRRSPTRTVHHQPPPRQASRPHHHHHHPHPHPHPHPPPPPRPQNGPRRLPMTNRELLTQQMLTEGFQFR